MMLEVLYGWDVYHSGFCFTIMCPAGIVLAMVTKVLINTGYMRETSVYFSAMMASVVGCALLFDEGHAGPRTLIAAGTVIYTGDLGAERGKTRQLGCWSSARRVPARSSPGQQHC